MRYEDFQEQVDYIYKQRLPIITLKAYSEQNFNSLHNLAYQIILTFDDGYSSNFNVVYPILREHGYKATFFITVSYVGKQGMLSWQQIEEMSNNGMEIGSHTVSHPHLSELSDKAIRSKLIESKKIIEEKVHSPVNFLAVPGGGYSNLIKNIAKEVRYIGVCASYIGINTQKSDIFCLRRIGITNDMSLSQFVAMLKGRGIVKKKAYKHILNLAKKTLGIDKYLQVKRQFLRLYNRES